jgi:hypothetical protein
MSWLMTGLSVGYGCPFDAREIRAVPFEGQKNDFRHAEAIAD